MPEDRKPELEEQVRRAFADLQAYMENKNNPLSGPQFARLVDEFFRAKDALVSAS
jgi:hypothetical protein